MKSINIISSKISIGISILLIAIVCITLDSCSNTYSDKSVPTVSIPDAPDASVSEIIKKLDRVVKLETNDSCIISGLSAIKYDGENICIASRDQVLLFNHDGKFISKISHRGRGAGEYLYLDDYNFKDGVFYILSGLQHCIYCYNIEGRYLNAIKLNDLYYYFDFIDDKIILSSCTSNGSNYEFVIFNPDTNTYGPKFCHFDKNKALTVREYNPLNPTSSTNMIYGTALFNYNIFRITEDKCDTIMKVEFNTKVKDYDIPKDKDYLEFSHEHNNTDFVKYISHFVATKDYYYICYNRFLGFEYGGYNSYLTQIDKSTLTTKTINMSAMDNEAPYLNRPVLMKGNLMVTAFYPTLLERVDEATGKNLVKELDLTMDSNPVLFFYKLK